MSQRKFSCWLIRDSQARRLPRLCSIRHDAPLRFKTTMPLQVHAPFSPRIIAKRRDLSYRAGERNGVQKIKNVRSADCVVGGFRHAAGETVVGSLLLGFYGERGRLNHVGLISAITKANRPALTKKFERLMSPPGFTGTAPGKPSWWNGGEEKPWQQLKPKLVVEVSYDQVTGDRFRHGTKLLRWRPGKAPAQYTLDQFAQKSAALQRLLK